MFKQLNNIETAFKHIRVFSIFFLIGCALTTCFLTYYCFNFIDKFQNKIYVFIDGKASVAYASNRKDNLPVEAKGHITKFHELFFTLDPDEKVIKENISKALELADGSAKREYDNLRENNYYNSIIAGNISQHIVVDSVKLDLFNKPYHFKCYATQSIIRSTSTVTRSLITEGNLREVSRSDNNLQGFLIEKWKILENKDLNTINK